METAELAELARDSGRADSGASAETVVARIDPATQLAEGQNAELWVDVRTIHMIRPGQRAEPHAGGGERASEPGRAG